MNTNRFLYLVLVIAAFLVTACQPFAKTNPADRFTGTWSGTMEYSDIPNARQDIVVNIPSGCATGGACGEVDNRTCKWEITLNDLNGDVFKYKFSKVLGGGTPCEEGLGTSGTLTLQPDGKLMREHHTELFIVSGVLARE